MLPEAESINKDGSQDGLMEAANIPLQSKEEDQMWKILKTDERYYLYLRYNWYGIMIFATFSSIPFMCNWISKNNSRHKYRKWKNGIFFITHDGSQTKWKPSSLAKVKSDINLVSPAQAPDINRRLQSQTESLFHKELYELLRWGGRHSPVTREWINLETFRHQLNSHHTAWMFSKDSKREIWPRERRSLTNGWVNIIYNYSIFVQRISIQKHQVPNKIDNFILHNYGKQYLFLWNIFGKLFNEDGMNKFDI